MSSRYGYNDEGEVLDEDVTITVRITARKRWIPQLLGVFARMEYLGKIGSSRNVCLHSDGDGDFRPRFEVVDSPEPIEPAEPCEEQNGETLFDAG